VAKCFLWSDIPFNIAKNPFYHSMFEVVAIVGPGYRGPSYNELRGPLLQGEKTDCTKRLGELRESWEITGCTVMSDSWTDGKGRSILNFLVNCPRGTMFIKSIDASAYVKDAQLLCELLDNFIQEIGPICCPSHYGQCCQLCCCWQVAHGEVSEPILDSLCCPLH
jgi:hypothetical protein